MQEIKACLWEMQDAKYKEFQSKLMPTVDPDSIIGVRTPELRALARTWKGTSAAEEFLQELPHKYYEENNLHAFFIEQIRDYDRCIYELNRFLPYVNNWATCDCMTPKVLKKNLNDLIEMAKIWLKSEEIYIARYGIGTLMKFYLDDAFREEYLQMVADVRTEEYYVNMMKAWYFATALAKQYDATILYIEDRKLDKWVHNKTIQKAIESYRITPEQKTYLRTLKWK